MEYPLCSGIANGGNELNRWESRTVPSHVIHTRSASLASLLYRVSAQRSSQNDFNSKRNVWNLRSPKVSRHSNTIRRCPKGCHWWCSEQFFRSWAGGIIHGGLWSLHFSNSGAILFERDDAPIIILWVRRNEKDLPKFSLAANDRAGRNEARGFRRAVRLSNTQCHAVLEWIRKMRKRNEILSSS